MLTAVVVAYLLLEAAAPSDTLHASAVSWSPSFRFSQQRFIRRDPIFVSNDPYFNLEHFCVPHHYKDDVSEIMIPYGLIDDRWAMN